MKRTACWTWDFFPRDPAHCVDSSKRTPDDVLFRDDGRRYGAHREGLPAQRRAALLWLDIEAIGKCARASVEVAMDRKQEMLQRLLTKETGKCLVFARTNAEPKELPKA